MEDGYEKLEGFYEQVYSQDFQPGGEGFGSIQWKGTDVCIDLHCRCGHDEHIDASFFYFYQCPACGAKYAVGDTVKLIPLTERQAEEAEHRTGFVSKPKEWDGEGPRLTLSIF